MHCSLCFTTTTTPVDISAFPLLLAFPAPAPALACSPGHFARIAESSWHPDLLDLWSAQPLANFCRGRGLPLRLRGHLLEVGCSAKCPGVRTRQETVAESKIRKQVSGGYFPSTASTSRYYWSVDCTMMTHWVTITPDTSTERWAAHQIHFN